MNIRAIAKKKYIYFLIIPAIIYYFIFAYTPMYGVLIAFKEFNFGKTVWAMPWVGFENFRIIFRNAEFWHVFKNTVIISLGRLVFEFPAPIILALLLNEIRKSKLKRTLQTVLTFPHFLSWVIVVGILNTFLSSDGILNNFLTSIGGQSVNFQTDPHKFRGVLYVTSIWKEFGWGSIIYLAAIAGINLELYEAAHIDGANRFQQLIYITWPSIAGTVSIMLILACGGIMDAGFDQIINMYNPAVYSAGDIIDTYVYRTTFQQGASFDVSTAIGLFKSVVNLLLLVIVNKAVTSMGQEGMF